MQQMMQYPWPGNVRELEHTVERAVLLCRGEEIEPANLAIAGAQSSPQSFENMSIDEVEALLIRKVLRRCDGNISQAAESLGPEPRRALSPHRKIWPLNEHARRRHALGGSPGVALLPAARAACADLCRHLSLPARHHRCAGSAAVGCLLLYLAAGRRRAD